MDEYTDEQKEKLAKEAQEVFVKVFDVIDTYKPVDIQLESIKSKMAMMTLLIPPTRTGALAAMSLAASHAPICGLTKKSLLEVVGRIYDAIQEMPSTVILARNYETANKEYREQKAKESQDQNNTDIGLN